MTKTSGAAASGGRPAGNITHPSGGRGARPMNSEGGGDEGEGEAEYEEQVLAHWPLEDL